MTNLRLAIGFLTRIPVGRVHGDDATSVRIAPAVPWFPAVGLLIGATQGMVYVGASELVGPILAASLSVAIALLITGAFHHDGLADIADAFGGGWTVEQRMEILKDSRLGTYGTSALVLALILEVSAISGLERWEGFRALVAAHALGRAAALAAMVAAPAAGDGIGASYMDDLRLPTVLLGALVGPLAAAVTLGWHALPAVLSAVLLATAVVALAIRKIGGVTGDVLGAIHVVSAIAVLVSVAAVS